MNPEASLRELRRLLLEPKQRPFLHHDEEDGHEEKDIDSGRDHAANNRPRFGSQNRSSDLLKPTEI
jgi:hypothetical protein